MKAEKKKYSRTEAMQRLKARCRVREISQQQAIDKFIVYGFSFLEAQEMVAELISGKYVDDARFAGAYIHDKVRFSHWGKIKIQQHLRKFGIAQRTITFAWSKFDIAFYYQSLDELIGSKYFFYQASKSFACEQKLIRFLHMRGFEYDVIRERLQIFIEENRC